MKIVAISDLHGKLPTQLPEGDVLVVAGDVCPDYRPKVRQGEWAKTELVQWLKFHAQSFRNIILTWGNHDFLDSYGSRVSDYISHEVNQYNDGPPSSYVYIADYPQVIELGSRIFYVSPYSLRLDGWAYGKNEDALKDEYRTIPLGVDVIVSHGPPMDYCDKLAKIPGFHAGSKSLKDAVRKSQPKIVICGHIHESEGTYTLHHHGTSDRTIIHNCSQLDIDYRYHDRPHIIEI